RLGGVVEKLLVQGFRGFVGVGAIVPLDFERVAALNGGPGIVGDDRDTARAECAFAHWINGKDIADAGDGLGFGGVEGLQLCAEDGAASDDGVLHAGHAGVDTEFCFAIGFGGAFEAASALADDGEVVGVFQRNGVEVGDRQLGGVVGKFAV